jgi:hypothetical protein
MNKPILFVDFDRTLFDTNAFTAQLWQSVNRRYDVDIELAKAESKAYFTYLGNLYDYDFFGHMRRITGLSDAAIEAAVREDLAHQQFLYEDSDAVFAWHRAGHDVRILTYGNEPYQRLKLGFTPAILESLPVVIIRERKADYLASAHADQLGWLVDDKPDQQLPAGFAEINLNRTAELPVARGSGYVIVNSLTHVEDIL